jgi:hypothetical protein
MIKPAQIPKQLCCIHCGNLYENPGLLRSCWEGFKIWDFTMKPGEKTMIMENKE